METLILIAQGIDKFFNFGSGSEQFYEAAKDHNALSRLIDATLTLPRKDRDMAREVLLGIRQQFNQIQDSSPNLPPNSIVHKLDMCIYDDPNKARGNYCEISNKSSPSPDNDEGSSTTAAAATTATTATTAATAGTTATTTGTAGTTATTTGTEPISTSTTPEIPDNGTVAELDDPDTTVLSSVQKCKMDAQLYELKRKSTKEINSPRGIAKILEYQWRRMEADNELSAPDTTF